MAEEVTSENLSTVTDNQLTIIDFWAPWCGPCKMMEPVLDQLENEYGDRIKFGKINVDDDKDLALKYKVMSIPSLVVFKNGQAKEKVTGYYTKKPLARFLDKKLSEVKTKSD